MVEEPKKILVFLPVFNEREKIASLIGEIRSVCSFPILVVDDGSDPFTFVAIRTAKPEEFIQHPRNLGPGAALLSALNFAKRNGIDILITIDSDGQHDPKYIPTFVNEIGGVDIVSGTRFHPQSEVRSTIPPLRERANLILAEHVRHLTGYSITDSACGFRAYNRIAIEALDLTARGYEWPFQLWIRARNAHLKIKEVPIPNIYIKVEQDLDERTFKKTINYCVNTMRRESLKLALHDIMGFKKPEKGLLRAWRYQPCFDIENLGRPTS